jgi:hypothetical protein
MICIIDGMGDNTTLDIEATEPELFAPMGPKREWLVRCMEPEDRDRPAVCAVVAEAGTVVIIDTDDQPALTLDGSQISEFRSAFAQATELAARDVEHRRLARRQAEAS